MAAPIYVAGMPTPTFGPGDDTVSLDPPANTIPNDILIFAAVCDAGVGETITSTGGADIGGTSLGSRRGLYLFSYIVSGYGGGIQVRIDTTGSTGLVSGTAGIIRGALTSGGIYGATAIDFTTGDPRPSSVTSTDIEHLAVCAIVYRNTGTIDDIVPNGWIQGEQAQNDGANSFDFQYLSLSTAQTVSGGAAALGAAALWASVTFLVRPIYPEGTSISASIDNLITPG